MASPNTVQGIRYGLLGLPLAFVALPLYVLLPNHYARAFGVPLATLGGLLLAARLLDAFTDPLIGRWCDRLFARSLHAVLGWGAAAAVVLATGFGLLFFPPTREPLPLLLWAGLMLVLTYTAYSLLSVAHQSWGAMLGGDEAQRGRIVAWREGMGLIGVLLACIAALALGMAATVALLCAALALGWLGWSRAPRPHAATQARAAGLWRPLAEPGFQRLLAVYLLNGIASAIPATLVLFFVQDRLQTPAALEPVFLAIYFACAALSMALWLRIVRRSGLARSWLMGMLLAVAAFVWATRLGEGDSTAFMVVCAMSGVALGSDLALPGAMLAGVIARAGDSGSAEGAYFGWWNFATKLNLALAAGLSLPLLDQFGYAPGARDAAALQALSYAYCLLPCALKLAAAGTLYLLIIRPENQRTISCNDAI